MISVIINQPRTKYCWSVIETCTATRSFQANWTSWSFLCSQCVCMEDVCAYVWAVGHECTRVRAEWGEQQNILLGPGRREQALDGGCVCGWGHGGMVSGRVEVAGRGDVEEERGKQWIHTKSDMNSSRQRSAGAMQKGNIDLWAVRTAEMQLNGWEPPCLCQQH